MAGIVIINGTFGSGKTESARGLVQLLNLNTSYSPTIKGIADGPHLVRQIKEVAHGENGLGISDSHHHPWVQTPEKGHNHLDLNPTNSHFPFTVRQTGATDAMIRGFLLELWQKSQRQDSDLIIAELGTGIPDEEITPVNLTTSRFLQIAREQIFWNEVKREVVGIVMVDAEWERRLERNGGRPQVTDGIQRSWGMVYEAMNITREPDFGPWEKVFPGRTVTIDNNFYI